MTTASGSRRPLSVAVLACDHVRPRLQHVAGDYADMFTRLFARYAPQFELDHLDVVGGAPVPSIGDHDAIVIGGSRHSVTDDHAWIGDAAELVRQAYTSGTPVVGICFGHQLIADALGGRTEKAHQGWGVGVHEASVTTPRPWMTPAAQRFRLLVSHQDQVTQLPDGATVLATSAHAPIAAFEIGPLLGFQGHPEFVPDYADALLTVRADEIGPAAVSRARSSLTTATDHDIVARWIASFVEQASRDRASRADATTP